MNPDTQQLVISPHFRLQWEEAQNAWVLLFPEGMVSLNGSAAEIMQQFTAPSDPAAVHSTLHTRFPDANAEAMKKDIEEFVHIALDKGWLVKADD